MKDVPGTVYLLHFLKPYRHAKHYRGWAPDVDVRIERHRNGTGARLMEVIKDAGIDFVVAKTEPGTRRRERQLKQRGASRDCPVCKQERKAAREGAQGMTIDEQAAEMTDEEMAARYAGLLTEDDRLNGVEPELTEEQIERICADEERRIDDYYGGVGPQWEAAAAQSAIENEADESEHAARNGNWDRVMDAHQGAEWGREVLADMEMEAGE